MKIAIPVFQTKISPRFDSSQGFVLLEIEKNNVIMREELLTKGWTPSAKIKQLVHLGIKGLICGGIDRESMQSLSFNGIKVYSWVTGEVEDAVSCYLNDGLESGIILGARGTRKGRWLFRAERKRIRNYSQPGSGSVDPREEVKTMPRGDGTGPQGKGPRSEKNREGCKAGKGGRGGGQGKGRGSGRNQTQNRAKDGKPT